MKYLTNKIALLIAYTIILTIIVPGCNLTGGDDPGPQDEIVKLRFIRSSMMRVDSFYIDPPMVHYWGRVTKFSIIHVLDTTFMNSQFMPNVFKHVSNETLWATKGNLPDTNYYSEMTSYDITMTKKNGEERTIRFFQIIPGIDSIRTYFEEQALKLMP